jgi:hypothetical protein
MRRISGASHSLTLYVKLTPLGGVGVRRCRAPTAEGAMGRRLAGGLCLTRLPCDRHTGVITAASGDALDVAASAALGVHHVGVEGVAGCGTWASHVVVAKGRGASSSSVCPMRAGPPPLLHRVIGSPRFSMRDASVIWRGPRVILGASVNILGAGVIQRNAAARAARGSHAHRTR